MVMRVNAKCAHQLRPPLAEQSRAHRRSIRHFCRRRRRGLRPLAERAPRIAFHNTRPPSTGCFQEHRRTRLSQILDLFVEDSQLNVHAGELEVRPPGAPTTQSMWMPDGQRKVLCWLAMGFDADAAIGFAL